MLTHEEREIAVLAVARAVAKVNQPRAVLVSMVADEDFGFRFPLDLPDAMALAREAIRLCEASQWDRLPPWLQQVLTKVAQTEPVAKILAKIATPPPDWKNTQLPSPFDSFWISRLGLPFVDRLKVREALKALNEATGPSVLIDKTPVVFSDGIYVPLNIIQHPSGHPKRVALRNNLLTGADDETIRYFTDTVTGSSGSPVFNDEWQVIGLHRGSTTVEGVSFQGRSTAVVNVGTQITAILDHLNVNAKALRQEIPV